MVKSCPSFLVLDWNETVWNMCVADTRGRDAVEINAKAGRVISRDFTSDLRTKLNRN